MLTVPLLYVFIFNPRKSIRALNPEYVEEDPVIYGLDEDESESEVNVLLTSQRPPPSRQEEHPLSPSTSLPLVHYPSPAPRSRYASPDDISTYSTRGPTPSPTRYWYWQALPTRSTQRPPLCDRNAQATKAHIEAGRACWRCRQEGLTCTFNPETTRGSVYRCDECREEKWAVICNFATMSSPH